MEKNVAKIVVGVVAGLAAVVLLLAWVGLILNYATLDIGTDIVSGERPSEVAAFSQWMSLALFLLLIPFMAGCVLERGVAQVFGAHRNIGGGGAALRALRGGHGRRAGACL